MLIHIVLWNFNDDLSAEEKNDASKEIKIKLEILPKTITEILKIEVGFNAENAPETNHDICLYSEFESMEHLLLYQSHADHLAVGAIIKQYTNNRICIDYNV